MYVYNILKKMNLMKARHITILETLLLLLCLTACTGNDVPASEPLPDEEGVPICWNVVPDGRLDGRALIEDYADLKAACTPGSGDMAIGIWSAYRLHGDSVKNVLGNPTGDVSLTYTPNALENNSAGWTYGEKYAFWKDKAVYYFNAYFPKTGGMTAIANDSTSLKGSFDTKTTQTDLMVTRVKVDTNDAGFQGDPVALPMEHALATLKFIFLLKEGNDTKRLKSFSLDNTQKTAGNLNYNTDALSIANWAVGTTSDSGRIYEWADNSGVPFTTTTGAVPYTTGNGIYQTHGGHLFIIPQLCESAPTFNCTIDMNSIDDISYENISLGTTQFEPGKNYIYTVEVKDNTLKLNLSIKDWNELDTSYDIDF